MTCRSTVERIERWLSGTLPDDECRELESHVAECERCRSLGSWLDDARPVTGPDLTGAILAHTSGSTCGSARRRMCELVDGGLEPVEAELVQAHVAACAECEATLDTLRRLVDELPALAELAPDERFVADVLARTLPVRVRWRRRTAGFAASWRRLARRPRFALEAAYAGTLVFVLLFGIPRGPLAGTEQLPESNPFTVVDDRGRALHNRLNDGVESAWESAGQQIGVAARTAADEIVRGSATGAERLRHEWGTFWDRLTSELASDANDAENDPDQEANQGDGQ